MNSIFAIDPGTTHSAYVLMQGSTILDKGILENPELLCHLAPEPLWHPDVLVVEQIQSYGMAVGAEVFETCVWSGRFIQQFVMTFGKPWHQMPRREVKLELCGDSRAKDANIRQALLDRVGPQGTKKAPGPTYGVSKDIWAALGVAVTFQAQQQARAA